MEIQTLKDYENHRMGHELCKDYLITPEKKDNSGFVYFLLLVAVGAGGVIVGHNIH